MESFNPYAAPTNVEAEPNAASPHDLRGLVSLRRAIRWAGAATVFFVLGVLFVCGAFGDRPTRQLAAAAHGAVVGDVWVTYNTTRQVILAIASRYAALQIWRYSSALSAAIREQSVSLAELRAAQRRCWYCAAVIALYHIVTTTAAPFVMFWTYR